MKTLKPPALTLAMITLGVFAVLTPARADDVRTFLLSAPNTYGWFPVEGNISYDFFPDGRLHVQGPDGEATMWEGTWKLAGDQVTLKIPALKSNETLTVEKDGDELLLDGKRYKRYAPDFLQRQTPPR
ncbi:MAG: hypothetical protein ACOYOL_10790 [Chthoniobacterales bacterium]